MSRNTPPTPMKPHKLSLIHRGYLYAQKHVRAHAQIPGTATPSHEVRMMLAKAWRDGHMASTRDRKPRRS